MGLFAGQAVEGAGGLEAQGGGRLQFHDHVHQDAAHERPVAEWPVEGLAVVGIDGGLEETAAGNAEAHQGDTSPAGVDHVHHAVESALAPRR